MKIYYYYIRMMKSIYLILVLYILMLSAGTCMAVDCDECRLQSNEHRDTHENGKNSGEQKDCTDCCTPFSACEKCVGSSMPVFIVSLTPPGSNYAGHTQCNNFLHFSGFSTSVWQPPKFC